MSKVEKEKKLYKDYRLWRAQVLGPRKPSATQQLWWRGEDRNRHSVCPDGWTCWVKPQVSLHRWKKVRKCPRGSSFTSSRLVVLNMTLDSHPWDSDWIFSDDLAHVFSLGFPMVLTESHCPPEGRCTAHASDHTTAAKSVEWRLDPSLRCSSHTRCSSDSKVDGLLGLPPPLCLSSKSYSGYLAMGLCRQTATWFHHTVSSLCNCHLINIFSVAFFFVLK